MSVPAYRNDGYLETFTQREKDSVVCYASLMDTSGGRNAFWSVRVLSHLHVKEIEVVTAWGKRGTNYQTRSETRIYTPSDYKHTVRIAMNDAISKMDQKVKKGYVPIDVPAIDNNLLASPLNMPGNEADSTLGQLTAECSDFLLKAVHLPSQHNIGAHTNGDFYYEFHPTDFNDYMYALFARNEGVLRVKLYDRAAKHIGNTLFTSSYGKDPAFDSMISGWPVFLCYRTPDGNICLLRYLGTPIFPSQSFTPYQEMTWEQGNAVIDVLLTLLYNDTKNIYDPSLRVHRADYADTIELKDQFMQIGEADEVANTIVAFNPKKEMKSTVLYRMN